MADGRGGRTVHEVEEVAVDELLVVPAKELGDGVAAVPDLAGLGEDEDDGVVEFGDEKIGPPLPLREFEYGDLLGWAERLAMVSGERLCGVGGGHGGRRWWSRGKTERVWLPASRR